MQCQNCGFDSPADMKFCGMCGAGLRKACADCQQLSPFEFRFCGYCGRPFVPGQQDDLGIESVNIDQVAAALPADLAVGASLSGERRYATVLIADVTGSTQLLEKIGSEAWVEVMNQALQIMGAAIYRFGGEIDQFRGDGLVAFFGARSAHEDDPERAVLSALVLQDGIRSHAAALAESHGIELVVRVGVNTGEVITTLIGSKTEHSEDTAMGGAVALAARLEAAAEPGTVLVSESTYHPVQARFKWMALGEKELRGLRLPVAVYRPLKPIVEAEQQHRLQAHGLWIPLVGRDKELEALEDGLHSLRAGIGGIALISGEAGMGKSRLVFEARQRTARQEALRGDEKDHLIWLQGRSRSYGQTLPDSMWVDMWQRWLGHGHWISQEEAIDRLRSAARDFWGERYDEFYPYLAAFLSLPLEDHYADLIRHLDAEGLRRRFFLAVYSWLEIMARQNPLVLVFSEVHWADEASLDLLKHCLPLCAQERIFLIVVFRPERTTPAWEFKQYVETEYFHRLTSLDLLALTEDQSLELVQRMIGPEALPEALCQRILEKSAGNPYYLIELIHSLIDQGILYQDEQSGTWRSAQSEVPLSLPDSLKSLLLARIDSLPSLQRRILQLAAVIGPIFWFNILEKLVPGAADLRAELTDMQRSQFIAERGSLPDLGREYAFSSTLVREAAYESILSSQRAELHLAVANYIEQIVGESVLRQYHGVVAYHYWQAGESQKELFHILLAAQEAQRIRADAEAIRAYERVLALLNSAELTALELPAKSLEEWKLEALRGLGQIQFGIGKTHAAERNLREAIAIGRQLLLPAEEITRLFYWLGEVLLWQNKYEEPIHLGEEGLSMLGREEESIEVALMNQLVAMGCGQLGDHEKFIDFTLRTAGFLQRLPYSEELRPAFIHVVSLYAYTLKNLPEARRWLQVLKQKAEEHHDVRALGEYFRYSAVLLFREGRASEAIDQHQNALRQFDQIGDLKHASRAWQMLGVSQLQIGDPAAALESFDRGLEHAAVFANEADLAAGHWHRGQALLCREEWEQAREAFEQTAVLVEAVPGLGLDWALSAVGRTYLAQGSKEEAQTSFRTALEHAPGLLFRNPYQANEVLSGLEQSFRDSAEFQKFLRDFRERHPEIGQSAFRQWHLEKTQVSQGTDEALCTEGFADALAAGWEWCDPFEDCLYNVRSGLVIHATNERNLHHINRSAPRLLRRDPVRGDFTLQAACQPESKNKPAIGGLLVWLSDYYWFCLEAGGRGRHEITLRGFMNNHDLIFGRGQLRRNKKVLRLERRGHWLSAACSADGVHWFSVGGCEVSTGEPLRLGLHAIGHINRLVYPGAFREGTAIRFDQFWLWGS